MLRSLFLLLCTSCLVRFAAAAESSHAHVAMAGQPEVGAQAVYDAAGRLWAVHRVSGHLAVSRSDDDGASWSNPVLVTRTPEPIDTGGDARPKIAVGSAGEIYVTWTKPLAEPFTGEIRFARSLDGGRTFSAPSVVHRDRQVITHRFDALAVNPAGQVFVAWIDKRDLVAAKAGERGYAGAALYFAVSDDRGDTFRGDFKVADHTCECCRIAVAVREDGAVTAFWRHIFAPNARDHAVAVLHADGSVTGFRRATFEDWRLDACPHHGPAIAIDATGTLHGVWFSGAGVRRGVSYGRLGAGRVEDGRKVGGDLAGHADVAVSGARVALAWKEFSDGRVTLRGSVSEDGGHTWRDRELAAVTGAADHPRVLARGGQFFVFWNTAERPLLVVPLR